MFLMLAEVSAIDSIASPASGLSNSVLIVTLILGALAPTLFAFAGYLKAKAAALSAEQSRENSAKAVVNTEQSKAEIVVLKEHINSRMTELVKTTKEASFAAGVAEQLATTATIDAAKAVGAAEKQAQINPINYGKLEALKKELESIKKTIADYESPK